RRHASCGIYGALSEGLVSHPHDLSGSDRGAMTHPTDDEAFRPAFAFSERALAILKRLAEQDFSNILGLDEFSRGMAFNRAAALVLQGRTEEAFQIYTALAMLSPLDSEALIGMARCAMTMLDHDS